MVAFYITQPFSIFYMEHTQILDGGLLTACNHCKLKVSSEKIFCLNCGYPQNGTKEQKKAFFQKLKKSKQQLDRSNVKIYIIVAILSLIAGFNILSGVILTIFSFNFANVILIFIGGIFAALAYWSLKRPISSIISGLTIIGLGLLYELQYSPVEVIEISFMNFLRYLFIIILVVGLIGAIKKNKIEKDLRKVSES